MHDILDNMLKNMMDELQFTFPVPFRPTMKKHILKFALSANKDYLEKQLEQFTDEDDCDEDFCDEHCDKTDCPAHLTSSPP